MEFVFSPQRRKGSKKFLSFSLSCEEQTWEGSLSCHGHWRLLQGLSLAGVNPWHSLGLFVSAPFSGHCPGWQSPRGDGQELPEDTAKELQSSSALTSGANRILFLGHSDEDQCHFQALLGSDEHSHPA